MRDGCFPVVVSFVRRTYAATPSADRKKPVPIEILLWDPSNLWPVWGEKQSWAIPLPVKSLNGRETSREFPSKGVQSSCSRFIVTKQSSGLIGDVEVNLSIMMEVENYSFICQKGRVGICPSRQSRRECKISCQRCKFLHFHSFFVFFLTKTVKIRWNWRCKIFSLKIRRCKIFDKFHVCQRMMMIPVDVCSWCIKLNVGKDSL